MPDKPHAPATTFDDVPVGTHVADRFVVHRVLGRGGSAAVYEAQDLVLDRAVALKLLGTSTSSLVDTARFEREIRLTARLVHPGIVPLFDSGWYAERLYYVMPRIEGDTLRTKLADEGPLPLPLALRLAADIAEALAYAHAMGIVHRDIKPENVFCVNGRALVADFGIARSITVESATSALTADGMAIGTVAYMSPEQAMADPLLDARADLYSLGCLLVETISGAPPFRGANAMSVLAQHLATPPQLRTALPLAPDALIDLLERTLAKDPNQRPPSAAAFIGEVTRIADELTRVSAPPSAAAEDSSTVQRPPAVAPIDRESPAEHAIAEARRLFNRGVQGGEQMKDVLALAQVHAEKALTLAPQSALGMAILANIVHVQGFRGFRDEASSFAEAQRIRLAAVAIDDSVAELQTGIGVSLLYWQDDFVGAERYLHKGATLPGHDATGLRHYAAWLKMAGRFEESLSFMGRAAAMDHEAPHIQVGLADVLMSMGRYVEAIAPLQAALRIIPRYDQAMERLEMARHRSGRIEDAYASRRTLLGTHRLFDRLEALTTNFDRDGWDVAREADLHAELQALQSLATQEDPFKDRQTSRQLSDRIIITCGELGDYTRAMDWVERGYFIRPGRLIRVLTDLPFDRRGLASDRRYARLLRTAGLEFLL